MPERGVAASAVVEALDVLEHRRLQLGRVGQAAAVDELLLERGEERLGDGVGPRRQRHPIPPVGSELSG